MPSYWLSNNLTTQVWLADRADFIFQCMVAHLSDYWASSAPSTAEQLEYGQILHSIAEELAQVEAYGNYMYDQIDANSIDPVFANIAERDFFRLSSTFPRTQWYDDYYREFLKTLSRLYLQVSSAEIIREIFVAYSKLTSWDTPAVFVDELYKTHGPDTAYNIIDQHTVNLEVPVLASVTETANDVMLIFDAVKPAHIMIRFISDPLGKAEHIHTATISEAFSYTMYVIEDRPKVTLLRWSDVTNEVVNSTWFQLFPGIFEAFSQEESGVISPAAFPKGRYMVSTYESTDQEDGTTQLL